MQLVRDLLIVLRYVGHGLLLLHIPLVRPFLGGGERCVDRGSRGKIEVGVEVQDGAKLLVGDDAGVDPLDADVAGGSLSLTFFEKFLTEFVALVRFPFAVVSLSMRASGEVMAASPKMNCGSTASTVLLLAAIVDCGSGAVTLLL